MEIHRKTMIGMRFLRHSFGRRRLGDEGLALAIALLSLVMANGFVFAPDGCAEDEFGERYRVYRNDVESGAASLRKGEYPQAIEHYSKAIEKSPFEASHYYSRGIAFFKSEKTDQAEGDFSRVIILDSRMISASVYRGLCRVKLGKWQEALDDYRTALSYNANDEKIHNNLAWLYATAENDKVRDKAKALEHAKKAAGLSKERNAEILDTLARAYFINGNFKEAIEAENRAIKLEPNNKKYQDNLKLYEQGK